MTNRMSKGIGEVLPTFIVNINAQRISPSRLAILGQFTQVVEKDKSYRITSDGVERGRASGLNTREILFTLRYIHGAELPHNVARSVNEWAQRFGQPLLQEAVWLKLGQPEGIQWLADQRFLQLNSQGGNGQYYISSVDLPSLLDWFRKRDIYPHVESQEASYQSQAKPSMGSVGIQNYCSRMSVALYTMAQCQSFDPGASQCPRLARRLMERLELLPGRTKTAQRQQSLALANFGALTAFAGQAKLVELYIQDPIYSELPGLPEELYEQCLRELESLRSPQQIRGLLWEYLKSEMPTQWRPIQSFVFGLRERYPKVVRAVRSADWSFLRRQGIPWEEVELHLLSHMLTNEFWCLGLVELHCTRDKGCSSFRLTSLAQALLQDREIPLAGEVVATASDLVLSPAHITIEQLALLLQFVEDETIAAQWLLRWDEKTIHHGVGRGRDIKRLRNIVAQFSCAEVVSPFLEAIDRQLDTAHHLTVYEGYLLRCQETSLIDSLIGIKGIAQCIHQRLDATTCSIYPAAINRLVKHADRNGVQIVVS